jgi:hypothetical protein
MECCKMLRVSVVLYAESLRFSVTLLCPNMYGLIFRISVTFSVPDQGVLGPVPPGDRNLTGRQPSGNLLP